MEISNVIYDDMRPMPVFKPEMRKANRDGLKSQTRRVMMPQPSADFSPLAVEWYAPIVHRRNGDEEPGTKIFGVYGDEEGYRCPYGAVEDFCYMREPMMRGDGDVAYYKDDGVMVRDFLKGEPITWRWKKDVLTSIFMPKEAARSIYRYQSIRVERVQDISEEDAIAEGVVKDVKGYFKIDLPEDHAAKSVSSNSARGTYQVLFDHINFERGFGWDVNPWVWVLGYQPVKVMTPWNVGDKLDGMKPNLVVIDDLMVRGILESPVDVIRYQAEIESQRVGRAIKNDLLKEVRDGSA